MYLNFNDLERAIFRRTAVESAGASPFEELSAGNVSTSLIGFCVVFAFGGGIKTDERLRI